MRIACLSLSLALLAPLLAVPASGAARQEAVVTQPAPPVPPARRTAARPPAPAPAAPVASPVVASPVAAPAAPQPVPGVPDRDAHETQRALMDVLRKHPPSLSSVLKLDPSLLESPEYLSAYPDLSAFLAQHPEVAHNPSFFLADVRLGRDDGPVDSHTAAVDAFRQFLEAIQIFAVFLVVVFSLMWLIRTMIDYRRWSRLSKVQAEVHTKLLDRFAATENLVAYMQTDAGKRFLESAPIVLESEPRSIGAPFGRILWSLQAGVVVAAAGLGMQVLSRRVPAEVASSVSGFGALAIAIGLGFVASAAASYFLSRKLGLLNAGTVEADATRVSG